MKITYKWLKDYIEFQHSPQELAGALTESGFEVEEVIETVKPFSSVTAGKVEKVEKHPDADKLSICLVTDGIESYQVICGAPNVQQGQTVPFAKVGAELPNGFKIKKAKIRGVESFGMICSKAELGLEKASDGIWAVEDEIKIGNDFYKFLETKQDYIFDLSITPNRPDCLSLIGFAREVAAITGSSIKFPDVSIKESKSSTIDSLIKISIEDQTGCPRYAGRVIKNISISSSPRWMQERLEAVGIRPINNIVDITNYVLMEYGHPLHAFDLAQIKGAEIIVRSSKPREKFTTLDGKERELPENTVLICDRDKPVAVGGIMGGLNSEVTDSTVDIFLESAYFKPERIALSSRRLGLSSEASQRFERGADPNGVITAINRASSLMQDLAGGTVAEGICDVYPKEIKPHRIPLNHDKINRLLGTSFSLDEIKERLLSVHLGIDGNDVVIPTFRPDLKINVDLAEETARLVNYSNLPVNLVTEVLYEQEQPCLEKRNTFLRNCMLELGIQEAFSSSMLKESEASPFTQEDVIRIMNPISDDLTVMRPSLLPGLLKAISYNINRNIHNIHFFEIGRIFKNFKGEKLPEQPYSLAAVICGERFIPDWSSKNTEIDFFDIKGFLENFISKISLDNSNFILYDNPCYFLVQETIALLAGEKDLVGLCGKIDPQICSLFGIETSVYAFELNVDILSRYFNNERTYKPVPRYPYSEKDMALVFNESVLSGDVLNYIQKIAGSLLNDIFVFDIFRGGNLPGDKKSLAVKMRFQSYERTLSDKEVDKLFHKIIDKTCKEFDASLRK